MKNRVLPELQEAYELSVKRGRPLKIADVDVAALLQEVEGEAQHALVTRT